MNINKPLRRLPLEGTKNTRDLGGYPCRGGAVRWGVFLRSDNPGALTENDIELLREYGVTAAVDLRREDETLRAPSLLQDLGDITACNLCLSDNIHKIDIQGDAPGTMGGLYIALLDNSMAEIVAVMRALAGAKKAALFHCAVGKDRTGVIAMLLLKLAGVADEDVVADYAVTEIYMSELFEAQAGAFKGIDVPEYVLRSRPESMQRVLKHLHDTYGSAEEYLLGCGVGAETIAALKDKLIEPPL